MNIHFAMPSWRRTLWSIVTLFVVSSVVVGIAVTFGFIGGKDPNASVTTGEYIRLVAASLTIWGPMYLLIAWQVSIPVAIGVGALVAFIRWGSTPPKISRPPTDLKPTAIRTIGRK